MTVLAGRRESYNTAHQLYDPDLSDEENRRLFGKCANLNGHNYVLEVVAAGEIDPAGGYVLDLKLLSDVICGQILRDVDHRKPGLPGGVVLKGGTRDQRLTITLFPWPGRHITREPGSRSRPPAACWPPGAATLPRTPGDPGLAAS